MLSEISQAEKDEFCIMYALIYVWNQKNPGLLEIGGTLLLQGAVGV